MRPVAMERGQSGYTIVAADQRRLAQVLQADPYTAAMAFVRGEFDVCGDLVAALRHWAGEMHLDLRYRLYTALARFGPWKLLPRMLGHIREGARLRSHYDRSNDFYRQFLDERMVYSCAYFEDEDWPLERAQLAKLDRICRKLDVQKGERLLDIGCGWGALGIHAAQRYGTCCTGCTMSAAQASHATAEIRRLNLEDRVQVVIRDYRQLDALFDKIASVGMFEHVGRRRLVAYFRKVHALLAPHGLFLNHGIVRPEPVKDSPETLFVQREVFPGGELVRLGDVIAESENAGFEVLDVENLRPHYALTCRAWVARLEENREQCLRFVDERTWRTWRLYLAASAANFEMGYLGVCQVLLAKRGMSRKRRLCCDYRYEPGAAAGC